MMKPVRRPSVGAPYAHPSRSPVGCGRAMRGAPYLDWHQPSEKGAPRCAWRTLHGWRVGRRRSTAIDLRVHRSHMHAPRSEAGARSTPHPSEPPRLCASALRSSSCPSCPSWFPCTLARISHHESATRAQPPASPGRVLAGRLDAPQVRLRRPACGPARIYRRLHGLTTIPGEKCGFGVAAGHWVVWARAFAGGGLHRVGGHHGIGDHLVGDLALVEDELHAPVRGAVLRRVVGYHGMHIGIAGDAHPRRRHAALLG